MAFFERWWREQDEIKKDSVRNLVKQGQIEFPGGGWSMNDEACAYYEDIIDQMELGHRFLLKEFNVTPKAAWQIDPFGK
jgi:alpha-mannosidase